MKVRFLPQKYTVRIERINTETKDSKSYVFVPTDHDGGLFDYMPGMFFLLVAEVNRPETLKFDPQTKSMVESGKTVRVKERKAYSIVTSPTEKGYIELLVKSEGGVFAPYFLEQAKVGDACILEGPQGKFMKKLFESNDREIACWSAGSGIPSTMSLMRYKLDKGFDTKIVVFDSNKTTADIIYLERIKELVRQSEDFKAVFTITREAPDKIPKSEGSKITFTGGRFWPEGEDTLEKYANGNWRNTFNTICGSSTFINGKSRDEQGRPVKVGMGVEDHLLRVGILPAKIDKDQYYLQ
jgi:ferredoxin-NADP reductase